MYIALQNMEITDLLVSFVDSEGNDVMLSRKLQNTNKLEVGVGYYYYCHCYYCYYYYYCHCHYYYCYY